MPLTTLCIRADIILATNIIMISIYIFISFDRSKVCQGLCLECSLEQLDAP